MSSVNGILKVVKGWHYDSWGHKEQLCYQCAKVFHRNEMARATIDDRQGWYCYDCAYGVVDVARVICPSCRNYHLDQRNEFCEECWGLDTTRRIVRQVHSETIRTGNTEQDNLTMLAWFDTLRYYGFRCVYCAEVYTDLDHYIPFSRGGATSVDNCVPACGECNSSKHATMPRDFLLPDDADEIEAYLKRRGAKVKRILPIDMMF